MTVQFLKDYRTPDGKQRVTGEVMFVSDGLGEQLIREGVAKQRIPPRPTETKTE